MRVREKFPFQVPYRNSRKRSFKRARVRTSSLPSCRECKRARFRIGPSWRCAPIGWHALRGRGYQLRHSVHHISSTILRTSCSSHYQLRYRHVLKIKMSKFSFLFSIIELETLCSQKCFFRLTSSKSQSLYLE
jgi:hypothetical protein